MDKEKILTTLAGKLGKTSLSERTIETYVQSALPAEGDDPAEEWYDGAVRFLTAMQGQYNYDVAKFKKDWETSHATEPAPQASDTAKTDDSTAKLLNELRESQEKLREQLEMEVQGRKKRELLSSVREYMKLRDANDEYVLDNVLKGVELPDDKSVKEIGDELLAAYDTELVKARGTSATPRAGGAVDGVKPPSAADEFFAKKKKMLGKD